VSPQTLLKISVLFATLSALLHQIWFYAQGLTAQFALSLGVMALSNWVGTLLVLWVFKLLIQRSEKPASNLDV
jgi:formate/nitrite transporter FocA (FNT family)